MAGFSLGIEGRTALVCGASKGLGRACAEALVQAGVNVTICARTQAPLQAAAAEVGALGDGRVAAVAADVTTEAGRTALLAACPDPDILVTNAPARRRAFEDRARRVGPRSANMIAPAADPRRGGRDAWRRFGRIVLYHLQRSEGRRSPMLGLSMARGPG